MPLNNLYQSIPADMPEEIIDTLVASNTVRIERIVSRGHCSAPGYWYDQDQHEWVVLLKGTASIRFADEQETRHLVAGDYLHIPAHVRHRVEATDHNDDCIWLAIFY